MCKIAILGTFDDKYQEIANITQDNRKSYCRLHGYEFVSYKFGKLDRTPHWGRVLGIKKHIKDFDWIFYLDTDLVIMNKRIKVENFIDENYNLIMGFKGHISTSGMLIRNCDWTMKFLDDWWETRDYIDKPYNHIGEDHGACDHDGGMYYEQSAVHFLYDNVKEYRDKIKVVPRNYFNSIIKITPKFEVNNYNSGDFIIHFPGETFQTKINQVKKYCQKTREMLML